MRPGFKRGVNSAVIRPYWLDSAACGAVLGGLFPVLLRLAEKLAGTISIRPAREILIKTFEKNTVFITGGASGIGLGMAKAFADRGMSVALADIDAVQLKSAGEQIAAMGAPVKTYTLDVTDKNAVVAAVDDARKTFGKINIVCANAGVSGRMDSLDKVSVDDWDWIIDVNLKGVVYVIQACMPYLLQNPREAHIVITSSISGLRVYQPSRRQGMYNTTKYGLVGLGEALSLDLEPKGVGVSILCPGVVNTNISHSGRNRPDKYGGVLETNADHELAKAAGYGTDPRQFGEWVVKAIEEKRLYVITHPGDRELVETRHQRILDAFDASDNLTGN